MRCLLLLPVAIAALLVPAGMTAKSLNPNQKKAKQNYRYKVPKLKYKPAKVRSKKMKQPKVDVTPLNSLSSSQ